MPYQTKPTDPISILPVMYNNKMYMFFSVCWIQVISFGRIRVDFYLLVERVLTKGNIFNSSRKKYKKYILIIWNTDLHDKTYFISPYPEILCVFLLHAICVTQTNVSYENFLQQHHKNWVLHQTITTTKITKWIKSSDVHRDLLYRPNS